MTEANQPPVSEHSVAKSAAEPRPFRIDGGDRYDRLQLIGWWDQERLQRARVLVVGAGALGNEVIKNLVLVGVGEIGILDFDRIETSNLTRAVLFRESDVGQPKSAVAARRARELNPDCRIWERTWDVTQDLGLGWVHDADVVIGCVDNREARLWINRLCWKVNTPWIDGGIQEISGVAKAFVPPTGACYECTMTETDYRLLQLRYSCPLLKHEDVQQGRVPTAPTIASLIGALQAQEALKLLHSRSTGGGVGWVFNGDANRFYETRFPYREGCLSHETYDDIVPLPGYFSTQPARELFPLASKLVGWDIRTLELDRDFLVALECRNCGTRDVIHQPLARVSSRQAICAGCGQGRSPDTVCQIEPDDSLSQLSLRQLGVPAYDIVKVKGEGREAWLKIVGDRTLDECTAESDPRREGL